MVLGTFKLVICAFKLKCIIYIFILCIHSHNRCILINHLCFPDSLWDLLQYIVLSVNMTSQDLFKNYSDVVAIKDVTLFYIKQVHKCLKNTVKEML